jgi:hypothetical protein
MSQLFVFTSKSQVNRLERYERAMLRREGARARAARLRREESEASWR